MRDVLERAIGLLEAANLNDLAALGTAAIGELNLEWIAATRRTRLNQRAEDAFLILTWPEPWATAYLQVRHYFESPLVAAAQRSGLPFRWRKALEKGLPPAVARVWARAEAMGLVDGIVVPIYGSEGFSGMVLFSSANVLPDDQPMLAAAHLLGQYLHLRANQLYESQESLSANDGPRLTPRELDCLRWAADGKTDWEIAQILKIADSTVHFHIENAKRKFRVQSRIQVIVRALQSGMLST